MRAFYAPSPCSAPQDPVPLRTDRKVRPARTYYLNVNVTGWTLTCIFWGCSRRLGGFQDVSLNVTVTSLVAVASF